jgi:hypothetical protein
MSEAIQEGFRARGMAAAPAALLAETCVTLMFVSLTEWLDGDDGRTLDAIILETLETLRASLK